MPITLCDIEDLINHQIILKALGVSNKSYKHKPVRKSAEDYERFMYEMRDRSDKRMFKRQVIEYSFLLALTILIASLLWAI